MDRSAVRRDGDALVVHLNALTQVAMTRHRYDEAAEHLAEAEQAVARHLDGTPRYDLLESRGLDALHALRLTEAPV